MRGTPPGIVQKTNAEVVKLVQSPALRERYTAAGLEPLTSSPAEFRDRIRREIPKWIDVARRAKIKVD